MTPPLPDLSRRGPHPVGAIQTEIAAPRDALDPARRLPCEIWYPARDQTREHAREHAGERTTKHPPAPHPLGLPHRAATGLPPISEPASLIAFSHGNAGLRQQSTFLMTHLASWGFVVVAPDHVGNTFAEMMGLTDEDLRREIHLRARTQRPSDLLATIRALLDEGHAVDDLPPLRPDAVGVLGHSYGGWTSLKLPALEPRVRALCSLAPVSEAFVGRKAFDASELPIDSAIELLVIAAEDDVLVDLESGIRPLVARLGPHARLETLDRADHFHFCDGVELLHRMHENNPRPNQCKPTRPLAQLRGEAETHAFLNRRVTAFFQDALERSTRAEPLSEAAEGAPA